MILTVGNTKGGTGKSTLAVQLALHRSTIHCVLLVDGDEQRSALSFIELRNRGDVSAVALTGLSLRQQVPSLSKHYADVIIDVGGRDTGSFRAALTITESLLIPVQPRTFDVWAMETTVQLVQEAMVFNPTLSVVIVLNMAEVQGHENEEARVALADYGLPILPLTVMRRKVYAESIAQGKSVSEMRPKNSKAIAELDELVSLLYRSDTQ